MAELTITVPDGQVARIQAAMGKRLGTETDGVARDATSEEIRQACVDYLIENVRHQERADAQAAVVVTDIGAT